MMSFDNELPDGEKEAMKALKRLNFQTNKTFKDGKYSITVEDMRVYIYYEDDCIGDFELTDIQLLTNLLLDTIEYEEDSIEEMKKINKEETEPVDNYTDLFDDEKEEDNMLKIIIRDCFDESILEDTYPIVWCLYDILTHNSNHNDYGCMTCKVKHLLVYDNNGLLVDLNSFNQDKKDINIDFLQDYMRWYNDSVDSAIPYKSITYYELYWK